jgi:hypothetical protein
MDKEESPNNHENKVMGAHWEGKPEIPFSFEVFEFELAAARIISEKKRLALLEAIEQFTWILKNNLFVYDNKTNSRLLKKNIPEQGVDVFAFRESLELIRTYGVDYHRSWESGGRFGCLIYDEVSGTPDVVGMHFVNAEYVSEGPLNSSRAILRKSEMFDLLSDVHNRFPNTNEIRGKSWLYNLAAYKQLFPDSYLANLVIDTDDSQWGRGSTIWGQFIDGQMQLRTEKAKSFLETLSTLSVGEPLSTIFGKNDSVLPPLSTYGPIADFYDMYGIKA